MINKYTPIHEDVLAIQFTRTKFDELSEFTKGGVYDLTIPIVQNALALCRLHVGNGIDIVIVEGDYIAKTNSGQYLAYDKKVFEKKYKISN